MLEKFNNYEMRKRMILRSDIIEENCGFTDHSPPVCNTTTSLALDLEKVFDLVLIDGLIHKLVPQVPIGLVKLISTYLKDIKYKVRVQDNQNIRSESTTRWCLSTTLFVYYINNIPKNPTTELARFADDTAIVALSRNT